MAKTSSALSVPQPPYCTPRDPEREARVVADEADAVERRGGVVLFRDGWPSLAYPAQFTIHGYTYSCALQAVMASKARLFGDHERLGNILRARRPAAMRKAGRAVAPFAPRRWDDVNRHVVYHATLAKCAQNPELRELLLATGSAAIGAAVVDPVWGTGLRRRAPGAFDRLAWTGRNWLGDAIVHARETLAESATEERFDGAELMLDPFIPAPRLYRP